MSTTLVSKAVSSAIITTMLALGCLFGYLINHQQSSPAEAAVTETPTPCVLCPGTSVSGSGGNTGVPKSMVKERSTVHATR